ncbi:MAG TPA: isoprenylcysteine carboxylmethyltransferase family protein [Terracidiphilus sp.]|jgi:protein-S-isoprenylcysteine O-methyltransferase Ste14|nr:isoprenylcysteine carboxylmethyltransferase family protein [Terracidiphilus sp.]
MRATRLEFQLRMAINAAIIILGFWAPWIDAWGIGKRIPLLEWLPLELSRMGLLSFTVAAPVVIAFAAALAALGALLRVWGTAYLGPATVQNFEMKAGAVMADGPYRFVRNPLYLGLWFMVAALAFLMPPIGAPCSMALLTFFLLRLILGEEAFLSAQLGEPYRAYMRSVPRLVPRLRTYLKSTGARPQWLRALVAEITPIGVFFSLAFLSWSYNQRLMIQAILISLGISLIARAFMPGVLARSEPAE